jgi:hypothetical protein
MRILNDSMGKTSDRLTGFANITKNVGLIKVMVSLEGSLLVVLTVLSGIQKHIASRSFRIQENKGGSEPREERFYCDFTLHLPFALRNGKCVGE